MLVQMVCARSHQPEDLLRGLRCLELWGDRLGNH